VVARIVEAALARETDERKAFLEEACGGDEELRREVESVLGDEARTERLPDTRAERDRSLEGQRLGHYHVRRLLGRGGMGDVYLAEDMLLGRQVALKLLPADLTNNPERMARFAREARLASSLNHPNILTVYEVGEHDGVRFMATELVDGESLRQRAGRTTMELHEVLDIAVQVASALAAAHEAGIVHRDVKPENLMVRRDGYAKVLDFGLAKLDDRRAPEPETGAPTEPMVKTASGVVMGTVGYMSPEQARGLDVDSRADIWSLGVVLYELVAGRPPFDGKTNGDVMAAILRSEPPPLARFAPDAPAELERIVRKALRKNPDERYQGVKDMALDVKSLKQRLEFEAEMERSTSPEQPLAVARATAAPAPADTSVTPTVRRTMSRGALVVMVLAIAGTAALVYVAYARYFAGSVPSPIDSIAVLPFTNATGDPDAAYLSDGISESLINSLSQLPGMKVIARTSSFKYRDAEVDPRDVGRSLGVKAILTGRVARRGDTLSISVELVDARDQTQVWGEQYNRRAGDLLATQSEISREIAERLRVRLTASQQRQLVKQDTVNPLAY
jgi:serine/threonine protein kinase